MEREKEQKQKAETPKDRGRTLCIGLGGTGARVLNRIRDKIAGAREEQRLRFLVIDEPPFDGEQTEEAPAEEE